MERRNFTRELKFEAVSLIKDRGEPCLKAPEDLGVHTSGLSNRVKKFAEDPQQAFACSWLASEIDNQRRKGIFDQGLCNNEIRR
jgi:transposase-like protein